MPSISHSEQQQQPPHLPASQQPTPRLPANPRLWLTSFTVPAGFSANTEDAISTGILTSKVRTEIVQSLSASILVHTKKPTPEEYNTICSKLIDTYPTLRDEYGGSGYVSWQSILMLVVICGLSVSICGVAGSYMYSVLKVMYPCHVGYSCVSMLVVDVFMQVAIVVFNCLCFTGLMEEET